MEVYTQLTSTGAFLSDKKLQRDTPRLVVDRDVAGNSESDFNLPRDMRNTHNENVDPA